MKKINFERKFLSTAIAAIIALPGLAYATNGMQMEAYGPISGGLGGAGIAFDHGSAAMGLNPATIGLMAEGTSRFDIVVSHLGIDITAKNNAGSDDSKSEAFDMPGLGWVSRSGDVGYGIGLFAVGGMGAEFTAGGALDQSGSGGLPFSNTNPLSPSFGVTNTDSHKQYSEVGVGSLTIPLTFNISKQFTIGASLHYLQGGMDIMWSMDATNFFGAMDGSKINVSQAGSVPGSTAGQALLDMGGAGLSPQNNRAKASGTMLDGFVANFDTTGIGGSNNAVFNNFYWGHFDFNDGKDFTQQTTGSGFAAHLGMVFQPIQGLTIGATYMPESSMSDFEGDATVTFKVDVTANNPSGVAIPGAEIPVSSQVKVIDFQLPSTFGLGVAYQTGSLLLTADWKRLNWSETMENFNMKVTADATQANPFAAGFAGSVLDFEYKLNWEDQDIISLGLAYGVSDSMVMRVGYNQASNPVPDTTLNFLFPATIEKHYSLGLGYMFSKNSSIDLSYTMAPEVEVTESVTESISAAAPNGSSPTGTTTVSHSQTNWQLMYSYTY